MQKTIENSELEKIIAELGSSINYKEKNIFTLRCEKLAQKLNVIGAKINEKIKDANMEYASTDKDQNFLFETVTITDKNGTSRTENTGNYKYTHSRLKSRDQAIESIRKEKTDIPVYLIKREGNEILFKKIFEKYSPSTISALAGIILDVPIDADGFIEESFYIEMTSEEKPSENGKAAKTELESAE